MGDPMPSRNVSRMDRVNLAYLGGSAWRLDPGWLASEYKRLRAENERLRAILDGTDDASIERAADALCREDAGVGAGCACMDFHRRDALAALRAAGTFDEGEVTE